MPVGVGGTAGLHWLVAVDIATQIQTVWNRATCVFK
jgi:hypothetical protein